MWSQPLPRAGHGHGQRLWRRGVPSARPARRGLRSQPLSASGTLHNRSVRCLCLCPARAGRGVCRQSVRTLSIRDGCPGTGGRREDDPQPR